MTDPVYRGRVRLNRHTGSLELLSVTVSDSGQYTVTITKTLNDPEMRGKTTLDVIERISGVSLTGPAEPLIEDQSSANLTCEGIGSIITTEWMKDGQPLSPSSSIIFSADLRSVSISPVRRSGSGEYQCRLSNPVSSDNAAYTMTVNYGPENVSISGQNEVEVGSKVTLTCSAESKPPASFIWMLNGRETGETTASYSIEEIDSTHSGNYTCTAWNSVTSLNTTATGASTGGTPEATEVGIGAEGEASHATEVGTSKVTGAKSGASEATGAGTGAGGGASEATRTAAEGGREDQELEHGHKSAGMGSPEEYTISEATRAGPRTETGAGQDSGAGKSGTGTGAGLTSSIARGSRET
ncbi:carcinoembryonic antigen-related cell adhesion molecule 6-like [Chanos chanos]|uniref:Carcinoembryonic antigen-related cell adhesion molecule 6-like n=1 Tax=Chanos chanos TaxID=29144 RepID=A0A6J2WC52_CHACN|nr:carcinoembryonic antigen-related cell adhesion molecule 6-like [Chanos chanos]